VRCSLTPDAVKTLIHAFISSRLYYCNSLLTGVCDSVLRKLRSVQNAAARLITNIHKFDHITPVLRDLHWLPVCQRILLKTAMLVYKCLCGLTPSYLSEFCRPVSTVSSRWQLRSTPVQSHGTIYLLSWEHLFRLLPSVWRLFSSTVIDCSLQRILVTSFQICDVYRCP